MGSLERTGGSIICEDRRLSRRPLNGHYVMQQRTLNYRCPHVQTLEWRRHYARPDWEAALGTAEGDEILLRFDASTGVVRAEHRDEHWSLRVRHSTVYVCRPGEELPVATLRRGWLSPKEVRFADGRVVDIDPARSFQVSLTEQVRFVERGEPLVLMRRLFWPLGGKRVRIETTDAGMAFPGRTILALLGFHEMVFRDMIRD